jgi:hypothetical protein
LIKVFFPWDNNGALAYKVVLLAALVVAGLGTFLVAAYALKIREMHFIWGIVKRRLGR